MKYIENSYYNINDLRISYKALLSIGWSNIIGVKNSNLNRLNFSKTFVNISIQL